MSATSEKVRKAIFLKSNVSALVGSGKLAGIFESKAPKTADRPYGIFQRQAPAAVDHTFGPTVFAESDLWLFKVIADADSSTTKEPQEFAEDMLAIWLTTLGTTLTLTGSTVVWMARFADMPPYEELVEGDDYVYHRGFLMRITTE